LFSSDAVVTEVVFGTNTPFFECCTRGMVFRAFLFSLLKTEAASSPPALGWDGEGRVEEVKFTETV
jgi:hypothetical protein